MAPNGPKVTKPTVPPTTPATIFRFLRRLLSARRLGGWWMVQMVEEVVPIGVSVDSSGSAVGGRMDGVDVAFTPAP